MGKKAGVKKSRGKTQRGGKDRARLGTERARLGTARARLGTEHVRLGSTQSLRVQMASHKR